MSLSERMAERAAAQDELLLRAVDAVNRGDVRNAHALAEQVLASDEGNLDARALLAAEGQPSAQVRRITVMFCDLVGSTSLSERLDLELYRGLISRYHKIVSGIVAGHGGFVVGSKGDGVLALFGHPTVHGNDTEHGVIAGLEIVVEVQALSAQIAQSIGEPLSVRVALHRGLLYIDPEKNDVFGHAANVASRLQELAEPGQVVVSDAVRNLVADRFDMEAGVAQQVKGLDSQLQPFLIIGRKSSERLKSIRAPLVGRADELARIRKFWAAAQAVGSPTVQSVSIVGEAGIGKTRLAAAITDEAEIGGAAVVTLTGSPDHRGVGYHPLRRLIETRSGMAAGSTVQERLASLADELRGLGFSVDDTIALIAPIVGLDPESGYDGADVEGRKLTEDVAKSAVEYLLACLGEGPALLLVEDHHDIDDATHQLITHILESGRAQTMVLATSRTIPSFLSSLVRLGPLTHDACLALVDAIAPGAPHLADRRRELIIRSDGVPLFLEELVRSSTRESTAVPERQAGSTRSSVPDALYEPLMARLYTSPATVAVAATAATIGREVDLALLEQGVDLPSVDVREAVETLLGALILERVAGELNTVRFHHGLVREVAYDLISPSRRREVHGRIADALKLSADNDEGCDWTIIANHFERADRPADAANAWREAADDARRRGLVGEARLHLGSAIDEAGKLPSGPVRDQLEIDLRLLRGYLASSTDGLSSPDATLDYSRCMELALETPDAPYMASTLNAMWAYYTSRSDLTRARQAADLLQSMSGEGWGVSWRPVNLAGYGMLDWWEGDFRSAAPKLQEASDLLGAGQQLEDEVVAAWYVPMHPTVAIHLHLAIARFMAGDTVGADEQGLRALAMCEDIPFPRGQWTAAYTQWMLSWMYMERGDHERSLALLTEVASIGEQHGFDIWSLIANTQHAATTAARNASGTAGQAMLGSLIEAWHAVEYRNCLTIYMTMLGRLAARNGDAADARSCFQQSLDLANSTGMRFYDAETLRCLAHLADGSDELVRGLENALQVARTQGARPFELRIVLDLYRLRGEAAAGALQAAVNGFQSDASYPELDEARARLGDLLR
jgi:class 3 adenylate cyclase